MDSDLKPAPDIIPSGSDKSDADDQKFEQEKKLDGEEKRKSDTTDKHQRRKTMPKSAQDMFNKKVNNMHVSGNVADSQQFIQNATIFQVPNLEDLIKLANDSTIATNESDKTYDLANPSDFGEYISKYKNNWHVTFAIILCVFDYIDLDDLKRSKKG